MTGSTRTPSRTRHKSLESRMPGKRARPVWREAARKRPRFIQDEHGTSLGSPPYPGCSPRWSPRSGRRGSTSTCTCRTAGRRTRSGGQKAGIPEELAFATKPELAIAQVKAPDGGRGPGAVGRRRRGVRPVRRVPGRAARAWAWPTSSSSPATTGSPLAKDKVIRADQAIADAVFERRSCGNGTKGPRYADWALIATADPREFLLIRRLPTGRRTSTRSTCAGRRKAGPRP